MSSRSVEREEHPGEEPSAEEERAYACPVHCVPFTRGGGSHLHPPSSGKSLRAPHGHSPCSNDGLTPPSPTAIQSEHDPRAPYWEYRRLHTGIEGGRQAGNRSEGDYSREGEQHHAVPAFLVTARDRG